MADFLGITKRKWLAFGIFSAIQNIWLYFEWSNAGGSPKPLEILLFFLILLIIIAFTSVILEKLRSLLKIGIKARYLAALLLFGIVFILRAYSFNRTIITMKPPGPVDCLLEGVLLAVASLLIYILSDFLAGLVFPSVPAKSKFNKKKSKS